MRRHFQGFLSFVLNRLMSTQGSLRTVMTLSACDVEVPFPSILRETARKVSSTPVRV